MKGYKLVRYSSDFYHHWNDFVATTKNATFLFHRDFMEYHANRFEDYSLLIFKDDKLVALFPANKVNDTVYSHQGLTYGGFLLPYSIKFEPVLISFSLVLKFLYSNDVNTLILKEIPSIYNLLPTDEVHYLNFVLKAKLFKRDVLSVVDYETRLKISNDRIKGLKRAIKHDLIIKEEDRFDVFWNEILVKNLKNKHGVRPTHTLEEITLLKKRFPNNIRQFNTYKNGEIVAGATIFETSTVAHCQYISGNRDKNQLGSLDFLHIHLINDIFKNKRFFDFGISNESNTVTINKGLLYWKEGFGARTITQDFYRIETKEHYLLDTVLI